MVELLHGIIEVPFVIEGIFQLYSEQELIKLVEIFMNLGYDNPNYVINSGDLIIEDNEFYTFLKNR